MTRTVVTHSEAETASVGFELAPRLSEGSVLLLVGDLGAGKTAFVRGLAEALGIDRDKVSSPTFALVKVAGMQSCSAFFTTRAPACRS